MEINVFVHTFEDVDYFYEKLYDKNNKYIIYSTHAGVMEYVKNSHNDEVLILSELIIQQEINDINLYTEKLSNKIIYNLDEKYSHVISKQLDIKSINFFSSLYLYHLPMIISGFLIFKELILKLNNKNNIIFNYMDPFYSIFTLKNFLDIMLIEKNIDIIWYQSIPKSNTTKPNIFKKTVYNLNKIYNKLIDLCYEYFSYMSKNKKTIIYMEGLYDLDFVKRTNKFRLIPYSYQMLSGKFSFFNNYKNDDCKLINENKIENLFNINEICDLETFLIKFLLKNFIKNYIGYAKGLKKLDQLIKANSIDLAIWGNPPVSGFKSLFYAYCSAKDIKVLGMQHGSGYGAMRVPRHCYSDFKRCDYYISYGFTQDDLKSIYPDYDFGDINIYPYGTTKKSKLKHNKKQNVDILFPVTNTKAILSGGSYREKSEIMHRDQINILNLIEKNAQKGITSLIKPFSNTNLLVTSVFLQLRRLQYANIEWNKTFMQVLNEIHPRCIIIEHLSTPLYEALPYDIEIFLLYRDTYNITDKAKTMLEKRVHMANSFEDLELLIETFLNNCLSKKRDNSFYNYYVYKENSKSNIIELLNSL